MNDVKISGIQLSFLLIGFTFGTSAVMNSALGALQDGWLAFIIGWGAGFLLMGVYVSIYLLYPSKTLIDILTSCFGIILGKILGALYIWFFIHVGALVLRNFSQFITVALLVNTPLVFVVGIFTIVTAYAVRNGIEVMGRLAELIMPIIPIFVIYTVMFLLPQFDFENLSPFLEKGIRPVLEAAFLTSAFPFGQTVVFLMLFNQLNKGENIYKATFISIAFVGLLLLTTTLRDILVLGPEVLLRAVYPAFLSTKLIHFGDLDPIVAINLMFGVLIKVGVYFYAGAVGIAQILDLDDYKPFVFPLIGILIPLAIWDAESIFEFNRFVEEVFPYYSSVFQVIIPVIILAVALIKKKVLKHLN